MDPAIANFYRGFLVNGIVPFWMNKGLDREHGGVLSCMTEDGQVLSGDKYMWSQGRFLWMLAAYHNRIERNGDVFEAARKTARFLLAHGRDSEGQWLYRLTREGAPLDGPISIYADCFAIYGLNEYYRAAQDETALEAALASLKQVRRRIAAPDFNAIAPYRLQPNRRVHGVPMILLEVSNELAATTGDAAAEECAAECCDLVMSHFLRAETGLIAEYLDGRHGALPPPEGSYVVPGHAIEAMWFAIHYAQRRGNAALARRACMVLRAHVEAGWDGEYGGLLLGIDAQGGTPYEPGSDRKAWWPHTEALYALLLAHEVTGESWCMEWFNRVHEWSFQHFHMPDAGEWRQRLNRAGEPDPAVIALPVKDPFHLPRAAILIGRLSSKPGREDA